MLSVCNNIRFVYMSRVIPTVHSLELYVYSLIKIIILCIIQSYSGNVVDWGSNFEQRKIAIYGCYL